MAGFRCIAMFAVAGVVGMGAAGCGGAKENAPPAPLTAEQREKEVQDNPNMPADAKARALEQIRATQAMNKGTQETNAKK